jgi:hypothetical protein
LSSASAKFSNDHFLALGLTPTTLSEGLLTEVRDVAARYAHRADPRKIISRSVWRAGMPCANDLLPARLPERPQNGPIGRKAPDAAGRSCIGRALAFTGP